MKATVIVVAITFFLGLANAVSFEGILNGTTTGSGSLNIPEVIGSSLTRAQRHTLEKFRIRVEGLLRDDYERTDAYLVGWLLSTKWNIFAAEKMLRRNKDWKRANKIEELGKVPTLELAEIFPYRLNAKDKDGCPVLEIDMTKWDFSSYVLQHEFPRDAVPKILRFGSQMFEKAERLLRKNPQQCQQYTILINWNEFRMDFFSDIHSISAGMGLVKTYVNNYPSPMKFSIMINTPQDMRPLLEIMKPVFSTLIMDKFNYYFKEREWKPIVLSLIDARELNSHYGGVKDL